MSEMILVTNTPNGRSLPATAQVYESEADFVAAVSALARRSDAGIHNVAAAVAWLDERYAQATATYTEAELDAYAITPDRCVLDAMEAAGMACAEYRQRATAMCPAVLYDDIRYALCQDAYADNYGTDGAVRYYASAVDRLGNDYRVAWDTTPEFDTANAAYTRYESERLEWDQGGREGDEPDEPDILEEEDACDWDEPVAVTLL